MIPISIALRVGFDALRTNRLRTLLSTLGVVIGVAALVAVLSLGDGMERFAHDRIRGEGYQSVTVQPIDEDRVDGVAMLRDSVVSFTTADVPNLAAALAAGTAVTLRINGVGLVYAGDTTRRGVQVAGAFASRPAARAIAVGRDITDAEAGSDAAVAVLSDTLARALAAPGAQRALVGRKLRFGTGAEVQVIGILERGESETNLALVPFRTASRLFAPSARRPVAILEAEAPAVDRVAATRTAVESWLAGRVPSWKNDVRVAMPGQRRLEQIQKSILLFKLFMGAIVSISLVVGGIGIMNVLLASVTERTREIGIRKSAGARNRDIRNQFLAESFVITGAGAVIGAVLGLLASFGFTAIMRMVTQAKVYAAFNVTTLLVAAGISILIGFVFGTYPARRAARLSPIDAIRHE